MIELARLAGVATPHLDAVYALVKLLGETLGRAKGRLAIAPLDEKRDCNGMTSPRTLKDLLASGRDDAPAILTHDAPPLTYAALRALIDETSARSTRSASGAATASRSCCRTGPEMATAFVSVASGATSAPLNPAYRADEFEFYMSDLSAKALVVEAGSASPAIARRREARDRVD